MNNPLYWHRTLTVVHVRTILLGLLALAVATVTPGHGIAEGGSSSTDTSPVRVRIHWANNDREFMGEGNALAIRGDTLLFSSLRLRSQSSLQTDFIGHTHGVHIPDLNRMEIVAGTRRHGITGGLIGGGLGLLIGILLVQSTQGEAFVETPASALPIGVAAGALLGAGIGAIVRTTDTQEVSREELQRLLEGRTATPNHSP